MATAVVTAAGSTPVLSTPLPLLPRQPLVTLTCGATGQVPTGGLLQAGPAPSHPSHAAKRPARAGTPRAGWHQRPLRHQAQAQLGGAWSGWAPVFGGAWAPLQRWDRAQGCPGHRSRVWAARTCWGPPGEGRTSGQLLSQPRPPTPLLSPPSRSDRPQGRARTGAAGGCPWPRIPSNLLPGALSQT